MDIMLYLGVIESLSEIWVICCFEIFVSYLVKTLISYSVDIVYITGNEMK